MNKVLEISKLDFSYHTLVGETKAVENISFDVYENEFLGIIGPSGSGKSTILSLIFGLLTPTAGQIRISIQQKHPPPKQISAICFKKTTFLNGALFTKI